MSYNNSDWLPTGANYKALRGIFNRHASSLQKGMDGTDRFLIIKASDDSLENEINDKFKSITLNDAVQIMGYINYGFSDSFRVCGKCKKIIRIDNSFYREFWYDCKENSYFCSRDCMKDDEITRYIDQARINNKSVVYWKMVSRDDLKDRGWFELNEQYYTDKEVPREINDEIREIFPDADVLYYMTGIESRYYTFNIWIKNVAIRSDQVFELIQEVINERVKTLEINRERALTKEFFHRMVYDQRESELSTMIEELSRLKRRMHRLIERHVRGSIK